MMMINQRQPLHLRQALLVLAEQGCSSSSVDPAGSWVVAAVEMLQPCDVVDGRKMRVAPLAAIE